MSPFDAAAVERAATRREIGAEARDPALAAAMEAVINHLNSAERATMVEWHYALARAAAPNISAERPWTTAETLMALVREGLDSLPDAD